MSEPTRPEPEITPETLLEVVDHAEFLQRLLDAGEPVESSLRVKDVHRAAYWLRRLAGEVARYRSREPDLQGYLDAGLDEAEALALEAVDHAARLVLALPNLHPMVPSEIATAIHHVQARVFMRPAYRRYLEHEGSGPVVGSAFGHISFNNAGEPRLTQPVVGAEQIRDALESGYDGPRHAFTLDDSTGRCARHNCGLPRDHPAHSPG